jgi:hypothetical protein
MAVDAAFRQSQSKQRQQLADELTKEEVEGDGDWILRSVRTSHMPGGKMLTVTPIVLQKRDEHRSGDDAGDHAGLKCTGAQP